MINWSIMNSAKCETKAERRRDRVKRTLSVLLVLVLSLSLVVAACGPKTETPTGGLASQVVIAPGPVGVGAYTLTVSIAELISKYTPMQAFVLASAKGAVASLVGANKADVGSNSAFTVANAFFAADDPEYVGKPPLTNLRLLDSGAMLPFALFVRGDSGIKKVADLKGKRIPTTIADTWSTGWYTQQILKAAGVDPVKDITPVTVSSIADGWDQLMAGKVDAFMTTVRGPRMLELESKVKGWALDMGPDAAKKITELVPGSTAWVVKKGIPAVRDNDIYVMGIPETYFATTRMSDETAYAWVKAIMEHNEEYVKANAEFALWGKNNAVLETSAAPYHAGAVKYYKEIGIWTAGAETQQKKTLSAIKASK